VGGEHERRKWVEKEVVGEPGRRKWEKDLKEESGSRT